MYKIFKMYPFKKVMSIIKVFYDYSLYTILYMQLLIIIHAFLLIIITIIYYYIIIHAFFLFEGRDSFNLQPLGEITLNQ